MKKTLLLFIVVYCSLITQAQNNDKTKTDLKDLNFFGKVKSVLEITYKAKDSAGIIQKGLKQSEDNYLFNEQGNFTDWKFGELKSTYKYSDKGYLVECVATLPASNIYTKHIYKYDAQMNQIEEAQYDSSGLLNLKYTYTFDDKGNKTKGSGISYLSEGKPDSKWTYKYDDKGNMIEMVSYHADGKLDYKTNYQYNEAGYLTEKCSYKSNDSLSEKNKYKYDDRGNKTEVNSSNVRTDYSFKMITVYDDKSNITEKTVYKADGSLNYKSLFKYNYDAAGNWEKQIVYINGKPNSVLERVITYY